MAKRKLSLDSDSALAFMQEIYIELCQQRETALTIQKKMLSFMKDASDLKDLGPIIKDQQKILNDNVEKKLTLAKLQTSLIQKQKGGGEKKFSLSMNDRELLEQLIGDDEKDEKEE